ncbi:hypothetical protein [Negadavirga shengliensis]|uniref:Seryl-tRNA synthetase n=1 Tax=Negadavirga shengliensis TaxID=1389218 RepID=A0ABV9SV28_9BACT
MKKIAYFLSLVILCMSMAPIAIAKDAKKDREKTELTPEEEARLEVLDSRVLEIKAMDFKEMSKEERKELRNELREINKEAKRLSGGVYISAGAIIVILIILLIIT